jgi:hypothetical protein
MYNYICIHLKIHSHLSRCYGREKNKKGKRKRQEEKGRGHIKGKFKVKKVK